MEETKASYHLYKSQGEATVIMQTTECEQTNVSGRSMNDIRGYQHSKSEERAIGVDDCDTETMRHTNSGVGSEYSINTPSKEDDN